jgi:hypothetical protein
MNHDNKSKDVGLEMTTHQSEAEQLTGTELSDQDLRAVAGGPIVITDF